MMLSLRRPGAPPATVADREAAITRLYQEQWPSMVRLALLMLGDRPSAEDATQEAFTAVYRRWDKVKDHTRIEAYLRSAVLNTSRSVLRRRKLAILHRPPSDPPVWSAESQAMLGEERRAVLAALSTLPTRRREVLVMRFYLHLSDADIAEPPALTSPAPRRRPGLVVALAAAAVVAAVAVPLAISRHDSTNGQVSTGVCPAPPAVQPLKIQQQNVKPDSENLNKLPFGPAPRVPFTMATPSGGYLEDLGVRVPLEAGFRVFSFGRVTCGWAVYREASATPSKSDAGVLSTSGKYTSFGQVTGEGMAVSPDGSQVVYVSPTNDHQGELRVMDVATGKEKARYSTDEKAEVIGWNPAGIWFMPGRDEARTTLWKPGSEPVRIDTRGHRLTAYRGTDRVLLSDRVTDESDNCVRVAVLDGSQQLKTLREKCGDAGGTLSPDGKVLVFGVGPTRGVLVDSGALTRLSVSPLLLRADHDMIWEDATHLITSFGVGDNRAVTIRCDVISGRCERISDGPSKSGAAGPVLGSP